VLSLLAICLAEAPGRAVAGLCQAHLEGSSGQQAPGSMGGCLIQKDARVRSTRGNEDPTESKEAFEEAVDESDQSDTEQVLFTPALAHVATAKPRAALLESNRPPLSKAAWRPLPPRARADAPPPQLRLSCGSWRLAVASGFVALLSEAAFAALGFGPAVMYEIFWQLFFIFGVGSGQLEEAVWNSLIMSSAVAVVQAFWLRKHLNVPVALLMTLPLVAGLPIGTLLLETYGSAPWIKRLLGAFFLAMVAIQFAGGTSCKQRIEDFALRTSLWTAFAALVGGLSRGLFGISAPVSVLLLFFSLDKDLWRVINAIYRIAIFAVQGSMLAGHLRPQRECVPMYAALIAGGIVGMVMGNMVAPRISGTDMRRWLTFFLAAAGLLMLGDGYRQLELGAALFSFVAILGMFFSASTGIGMFVLKSFDSAVGCKLPPCVLSKEKVLSAQLEPFGAALHCGSAALDGTAVMKR